VLILSITAERALAPMLMKNPCHPGELIKSDLEEFDLSISAAKGARQYGGYVAAHADELRSRAGPQAFDQGPAASSGLSKKVPSFLKK